MIGVPTNLNSVHIPIIQTGCLKAEFDSTYPIHLNGIISQEEFHQSISKINRTISSRKLLIICAVVFALAIIGGMILFVVGGITGFNSRRYGFSPLVGVGIGMTLFGSLFFSIGCCVIQSKRAERMRQAIAEESMKYSTRSPTPCSWRLDVTRQWIGGYGHHHNNQAMYHLVIDIGRLIAPGNDNRMYYSNQIAPEPTAYFGQQDNYPPPPYSGQSAQVFCSGCGASRQDLTAKYCPSCGQAFNKY